MVGSPSKIRNNDGAIPVALAVFLEDEKKKRSLETENDTRGQHGGEADDSSSVHDEDQKPSANESSKSEDAGKSKEHSEEEIETRSTNATGTSKVEEDSDESDNKNNGSSDS